MTMMMMMEVGVGVNFAYGGVVGDIEEAAVFVSADETVEGAEYNLGDVVVGAGMALDIVRDVVSDDVVREVHGGAEGECAGGDLGWRLLTNVEGSGMTKNKIFWVVIVPRAGNSLNNCHGGCRLGLREVADVVGCQY